MTKLEERITGSLNSGSGSDFQRKNGLKLSGSATREERYISNHGSTTKRIKQVKKI